MKLGVFTPVFGNRTLDQVLKKMRSLPGVSAIELATGGWPGSAHVDVNGLLGNPHKAEEFLSQIRNTVPTIISLTSQGNPLQPNKNLAHEYDDAFRKSVRLTEMLKVQVVVTLS